MYKEKLVQLPIAELIEDMDLYPRHAVDDAHVRTLCLALEAGNALPPVVADAKSKRITDGWHRVRAYRRTVGDDAVIDVLLLSYPDEAAMLFDAIERNSAHGRKLDVMDQRRSVIMLQTRGFDDARIAAALRMPEARIKRFVLKVATVKASDNSAVPGTKTLVLKRPVRHLAGETLTKAQSEVHAMLPGTSFLLVAKQLTNALTHKMVDMEDEKLVAQLHELHDALTLAFE